MITLRVNNQNHQFEIDPDTPLLWVLREQLGLSGTKFGCGIGECGACTVLIDGRAERSCTLTLAEASGKEITTIEGAGGSVIESLFRAWTSEDVPQCGYCQPGQLLTAAAMLTANPKPDTPAITRTMATVLCRCGSYQGIRKAINLAIEEMQHGKE